MTTENQNPVPEEQVGVAEDVNVATQEPATQEVVAEQTQPAEEAAVQEESVSFEDEEAASAAEAPEFTLENDEINEESGEEVSSRIADSVADLAAMSKSEVVDYFANLLETKPVQSMRYDVEVVGLPNLLHVGLGHHTGLLPTLLQVAEGLEGVVHCLVAADEFFELLNNLQLNLQVLLFKALQRSHIFLTASAIDSKVLFEPNLLCVYLRVEILGHTTLLNKCLAGSLYIGPVVFVEGNLHSLDILADILHLLLLQKAGKAVEQLLLRATGNDILLGGSLLNLCGLLHNFINHSLSLDHLLGDRGVSDRFLGNHNFIF